MSNNSYLNFCFQIMVDDHKTGQIKLCQLQLVFEDAMRLKKQENIFKFQLYMHKNLYILNLRHKINEQICKKYDFSYLMFFIQSCQYIMCLLVSINDLLAKVIFMI